MIIDHFFLELLCVEWFLIDFYQSYKISITGIFLMALQLLCRIGEYRLLPIQQLLNMFPIFFQNWPDAA
jgi:hypothetical protein